MNTVVILIHGYNVSQPNQTVGRARPILEEYSGVIVENYTYGYWPLPIQVSRRNVRFAKEVADRVNRWKNLGYKVFVLCHSNGAVITHLARNKFGAEIDRVLAVHPALKRHIHPCPKAEKVIVVHNQGDLAVVAGGWLGKITSKIMPSWESARPWGQMGQDGYRGSHANVENVDTGHCSPRCWGHSDEFQTKNLPVLKKLIKLLMRGAK